MYLIGYVNAMYKRILKLPDLLEKKSHLFLGPRSTGKTTLIDTQLEGVKKYDLLDSTVFRALLRHPKLLDEENDPKSWVVIDEIQKLPELLDEVQRLIHKKQITFLLTGSSARKLKRGAANLLGGRLWEVNFFPLTSKEVDRFNLLTYLNTGGLPHVYASSHAQQELKNYINLYLKEEIYEEALVRRLSSFSECLDVLALSNGEEISYENISREAGIPASTVKNYMSIIEDTLIGFVLKPFVKTKKRKAISRAKFYIFDVGVVNSLANRGSILNKSHMFGQAFEHFLIQEVRAYLSYSQKNEALSYWRSVSRHEVDMIIGREWALEIKTSDQVHGKHLQGLRALKEEGLIRKFGVISQDPHKRKTDEGFVIYPWAEFLRDLWSHKIV